MSGCQVVSPQLEVGRLCWVAEVNTHGNRHRGLWLQTLWERERGEERKSEWQGHSVQCGGGWSKGREEEEMEEEEEEEGSSRVEQTGIHTTCVFYFTKQGHRVWEIYPSISLHTPLASGKKTHEGLAYFHNNRPVKESVSIKRRAEGDRQSRRDESETESTSKAKNCWRESLEEEEEEEGGGRRRRTGEVKDEKNIDRQKHPPRSPSRLVFLSPWSRAVVLYNSFHRRRRLQRKPLKTEPSWTHLQSASTAPPPAIFCFYLSIFTVLLRSLHEINDSEFYLTRNCETRFNEMLIKAAKQPACRHVSACLRKYLQSWWKFLDRFRMCWLLSFWPRLDNKVVKFCSLSGI